MPQLRESLFRRLFWTPKLLSSRLCENGEASVVSRALWVRLERQRSRLFSRRSGTLLFGIMIMPGPGPYQKTTADCVGSAAIDKDYIARARPAFFVHSSLFAVAGLVSEQRYAPFSTILTGMEISSDELKRARQGIKSGCCKKGSE